MLARPLRIVGILATAACACTAPPRNARGQVAPKPETLAGAWGDQGDGSFVNPVLPADYSDIDAIRVGDDYYAISSTLHVSPGMTVLQSRDLVNWRIIGHAIDDLSTINPHLNWDRMDRYGRGVWAGAIRHHAGRYWIYFGDPDEGLFMTTALAPAGPWTPPHCVWQASGWNDPCPFWDDDGQGYLVTTNFATDPRNGKAYNIHLFRISDDGRGLLPESDRIIHQSRGSEANKLDKIDGLYYHYYSEVRSEGRVAMMNRAASLEGPWESRQLNHVRKGVDNEPNQGGIVQTPAGQWWFLTHQGTGDWEGRPMALLPVTWRNGWPLLGAVGNDGVGSMMWTAAKPVAGQPIIRPQTDDEFDERTLALPWGWNHQPRADMWSLSERPDFLRLRAFQPLRPGDFKKAGNTLSQRTLKTKSNVATVKFDLSGMADGQTGGMCHFSQRYATLGVAKSGGVRTLVHNADGVLTQGPVVAADALWLRSTWGEEGKSQFAYSMDGEQFTPFGPRYAAAFGHYRGDRIGVFTYNDQGEAGWLDVDWFHYEFVGPAEQASAPNDDVPGG